MLKNNGVIPPKEEGLVAKVARTCCQGTKGLLEPLLFYVYVHILLLFGVLRCFALFCGVLRTRHLHNAFTFLLLNPLKNKLNPSTLAVAPPRQMSRGLSDGRCAV